MKKIVFLLLAAVLLTSGCYDAYEPNDIAYVTALGIDNSDEENIFEFTIQFAKTTQISGGSSQEGGKEGSNILEIINVKAPTVYSGINIANQVVSKRFTLAHTKLIVFSDEVARSGVEHLFDTFGRNSDIRPNIYVAVSNGKAKDYLENVKPVVEVNPINYYRLIYEPEYGGYVPVTILKDFYFQIDGNDRENVLPLAGVSEENKEKAEEEENAASGGGGGEDSQQGGTSEAGSGEKSSPETNKQGFEFLMKNYIAGDMDVDKKNASEVMGMAVFKGDKMIGTMDSLDCLIYNMICGSFRTSYASFYNEDTPDLPVTISLEQERMPQVSVQADDSPKIKVGIYLEGQLMSESVDVPVEEDINKLELQVEQEIKTAAEVFLKKTAEDYDSDIVGFGQWAKINFLTYDEFEKYDWYSHYNKSEFEVNVDFKLRRIGFIDLSRTEE